MDPMGVPQIHNTTRTKAGSLEPTGPAIPSQDQPGRTAMKDYTATVTILESINDGIFILNQNGAIEYANGSALSFLNISLDEVVGHSIDEFLVSTTQADARPEDETRDMITRISEKVFGNIEAQLVGKVGQIPVLLNFSAISDSSGRLDYVILTAKELTYHKSLERELHLQRAKSVSYDRLRALGEMSVGLVHEMGQPLAALELQVEDLQRRLVSQTGADDSIRQRGIQIEAEVRRLSSILERVRQFALQRGRESISKVNLHTAIRAAIAFQEYDFSDAGVMLDMELCAGDPVVLASQPALEQVMLNLMANARDAYRENAGSHRDPQVLIRTSEVDAKWVRVEVIDWATEPGKELDERIMEPFFSTRDPEKHTGTGLSVAHAIVNGLGGDIRYRRAADGATVFRILIPLETDQEREQLFNLIELLHQG